MSKHVRVDVGRLVEGAMDRECIQLCSAMNSCSGIKTYCSCCGHGRASMRIYFSIESRVESRFRQIISRFPKWEISTGPCGFHSPKIGKNYKLASKAVGEEAYKESVKIANQIRAFLREKKKENG